MKSIHDFVNRIIPGDCVKVMQEIPAGSIDFIATDPPYLVNYTSRDGRSVINDDRDAWLMPAFAQMYRVLKYNSFAVSFYGWNKVDTFFAVWKAAGFRPVGHLVWVKPYHSNTGFVRYSHEEAYLLAKGVPDTPPIILRDVLEWHYTGNGLHPTQKPVMAMLPLIMAFSRMREIVLDPFVGSGTTAVAAKQLGRRYIGIEIDPVYAKQADERVKQASKG
jgi:site-specific DNA-methyltransferase (adenine-specific)